MLTPESRRERFVRLLTEDLDEGEGVDRLAGALATWKVEVRSDEVERVADRLREEAGTLSPIVRSLRRDRDRPSTILAAWLALVASQMRFAGPAFWLASLGLSALGAMILIQAPTVPLTIALWLLAPLLALLGVQALFRGSRARVVELELACPPSPTRLAVARLFVVLGYDMLMLKGVSLALAWLGPAASVDRLVGHY